MLKLPELKQILAARKLRSANTKRAQLVMRHGIVVQRAGESQLVVEGPACDELVVIKDSIVSQYTAI